jgi:universal stress protein A
MKIERILFPIDFSEGSMNALDYAVSLSKEYNAKLYLLHVVHDISMTAGWQVPHIRVDELYRDMEEGAKKQIEKCCEEDLRDVKDVEKIVIRGIPDEEILKVARDEKIDIIVIGTHGRTGIDRLLFGSTAEKVVRRSPCPVLSVRLPEHRIEIHRKG